MQGEWNIVVLRITVCLHFLQIYIRRIEKCVGPVNFNFPVRVVQKWVRSDLTRRKSGLNLNRANYLDMNSTLKPVWYKFNMNEMMHKIRLDWSQENSFDMIFFKFNIRYYNILKVKNIFFLKKKKKKHLL